MSFSNKDYLYNHLPARYRREDAGLFLYRFLQWFGEQLDAWEGTFDAFSASIDPETAAKQWIEFWLLVLFGWSWFPQWFTITDFRRLYGNFAGHLARRGTRVGIEKWLRDFGVVARVFTRTPPWGEWPWGETTFIVTQPLVIVIEILLLTGAQMDASYWGEGAWGEAYWTTPQPMLEDADILRLIRFVQPQSQEITLIRRNMADTIQTDERYWVEVDW